jgi:hypothetical protein
LLATTNVTVPVGAGPDWPTTWAGKMTPWPAAYGLALEVTDFVPLRIYDGVKVSR